MIRPLSERLLLGLPHKTYVSSAPWPPNIWSRRPCCADISTRDWTGWAYLVGVPFEGATIEVEYRGSHFPGDVHLRGRRGRCRPSLTRKGSMAIVTGEEVATRARSRRAIAQDRSDGCGPSGHDRLARWLARRDRAPTFGAPRAARLQPGHPRTAHRVVPEARRSSCGPDSSLCSTGWGRPMILVPWLTRCSPPGRNRPAPTTIANISRIVWAL